MRDAHGGAHGTGGCGRVGRRGRVQTVTATATASVQNGGGRTNDDVRRGENGDGDGGYDGAVAGSGYGAYGACRQLHGARWRSKSGTVASGCRCVGVAATAICKCLGHGALRLVSSARLRLDSLTRTVGTTDSHDQSGRYGMVGCWRRCGAVRYGRLRTAQTANGDGRHGWSVTVGRLRSVGSRRGRHLVRSPSRRVGNCKQALLVTALQAGQQIKTVQVQDTRRGTDGSPG